MSNDILLKIFACILISAPILAGVFIWICIELDKHVLTFIGKDNGK